MTTNSSFEDDFFGDTGAVEKVEVLYGTIIEDWTVVSFEATKLDADPLVLDSKPNDEWLVVFLDKTGLDLSSCTIDNDRLPSRATELGSIGTICTILLLDDISINVGLKPLEGDITNVLETDWLTAGNFELNTVAVC